MGYTQQLLLLTQQRSTWPWPISLYFEECTLWHMWVKKYSCLAELAVFFAQYFTMINPYPLLSTVAAAPRPLSVSYFSSIANTSQMWLDSGWVWPFMGHRCLLLGFCRPVGLCTCTDILTQWHPEKILWQLYVIFPIFWTPRLFPSARVRRKLPLGFRLHSSHIRRTSLGEREARSEMLT